MFRTLPTGRKRPGACSFVMLVALVSLWIVLPATLRAQSPARADTARSSWEFSAGALGPWVPALSRGNHIGIFSAGHRWRSVWRRVDLRVHALYRPIYGVADGIGAWSSGLWRLADGRLGSVALEPYAIGGVGLYTTRLDEGGAHWGAGLRASHARRSLALEWTRHPALGESLLMLTIGLQGR